MPTFDKLHAAITATSGLLVPCRETMYRSAATDFATDDDLVSGEGSRLHGGRWNPVGIAAVYASRTPETAMQEALAHFRYYGLPIQNSMPRLFVALDVQLVAVLDASSGVVLGKLGLSVAGLARVDWRADVAAGNEPLTHAIGRAAQLARLEGLLVPSAADASGVNLVAFPGNFRPGSSISVL